MIKMSLMLLLIAGLNVYMPYRLGNLLGLKSKWLYVLFAVGFVSIFAAMRLVTKSGSIFVTTYYNLATFWLGNLLFLFCIMAVFEVLNLIFAFPKPKAAYFIIALTLLIDIYAVVNASFFKTAYVDIPVKNLSEEIKIMQISDVHLGAHRGAKYLEKIIQKTNELNPDFVVITGDIADSKSALTKNMFTPLKNLHAPSYFVSGNHDVYVGLEEIIKRLKENGIIIMQNEAIETNGIKLIGLNYMKADNSVYDPHQVNSETIKDTLPQLDFSGEMPKIVIHHGPWGVEYMNEYGTDLVIAGHTHAGQIFPATLMAKSRFPYLKGLKNYKGTYIYVSQGAGTFFPRMRLGTNNEINLITLKPLQSD
jgi:predicted MPP superfamily phosphohydrolase